MSTIDWLAVPQQLVLEVTAGRVLHDGDGELTSVRNALAWYPDDVWRWLLACQWRRLAQEEAFVGRAAEVGDELGSRVLAARLARDLIRLCLLLDRQYAPYSKWLGTAFARLPIADTLGPVLEAALVADAFPEREDALVAAFEMVARCHNDAGATTRVATAVYGYHRRPYRVLGSGRFVEACLLGVRNSMLRGLPLIGAVDQIVDSTDVLSYVSRARRVILGVVGE